MKPKLGGVNLSLLAAVETHYGARSAVKPLLSLLTAGWFLCPTIIYASETAQARLFCESLQFQEGTTFGGTLDLNHRRITPFNGELMPYSKRHLGQRLRVV